MRNGPTPAGQRESNLLPRLVSPALAKATDHAGGWLALPLGTVGVVVAGAGAAFAADV